MVADLRKGTLGLLTDESIGMGSVITADDRVHLRHALELAEGGRGRVSPNPLVGAVIVRDGEHGVDGFTATESGESKWISGASSRALVHAWRAEADAVAVGIATALADDPLLTARDTEPPPARQPARVVFDSAARLSLDSRLLGSLDQAPVFLITAAGAPADRVSALRDAGAEVIELAGGPVDRVRAALDELGRRGIASLLLEGGAVLAASFRDADEFDELRLFIAPVLLGDGRPLLAGGGAGTLAGAQRPLASDWERCGDDILFRARLREW